MRSWQRTLLVMIVGTVLSVPAVMPLCADELVAIKAALEAPLLPDGHPLREMRAFIEPRIVQLAKYAIRLEWEQAARQMRREMLDKIVFRGTATQWRDAATRVEWLDTIPGGDGYRIRKFRYEVLPGMWVPGLLYLPDRLDGLVPLALHVNGHAPEGKAVGYKQLRSINLAKRGMLVLNLEWFGMGQLATPGFSHYRMNQLDLCGGSGLAPFYLALHRGLDLGLALEHADPKRVVVSGLSGGGWQTIVISGLDQRVTLANPVAGYGSFRTNILFDDLGDSEQSPTDMATVADYTHLTALRAPRPTLLTYNAADDCCFKSGHALEPLLQAAHPAFALYDAGDRIRSHVNHVPGTHNFEQENREQLYAMIGDFFYPGDKSFVRSEIPSTAEVKTPAELDVPLPTDNVDFHRLAASLLPSLPREAALPTERAKAEPWQRERRKELIALLKVPNYDVASGEEKTSVAGDCTTTSRVLKCSTTWSVPAVEFASRFTPALKTAILVSDAGRTSLAAEVVRLTGAGYRVLAVDPLLWGESAVKAQDPAYLFPLFVAAVGEHRWGFKPLNLRRSPAGPISRNGRKGR